MCLVAVVEIQSVVVVAVVVVVAAVSFVVETSAEFLVDMFDRYAEVDYVSHSLKKMK
jgi:hypothetical protein